MLSHLVIIRHACGTPIGLLLSKNRIQCKIFAFYRCNRRGWVVVVKDLEIFPRDTPPVLQYFSFRDGYGIGSQDFTISALDRYR